MDTAPTTPTPAAAAPPPAPAPHPEHHHTPSHETVAAHDYPSSPFVTAKMGIVELFKNGKRGLPGVLIVTFLLFLGVVVTMVIALVTLFASVLVTLLQANTSPTGLQEVLSQLPPDVIQALSTAAYAPFLGVIGFVAFVGSMILSAYLQAIMLAAVTETTVQNKTLVLGEALKLAGRKLWPVVGQALLVMLVVGVVLLAFFMLIGVVAGAMGASGDISGQASAGAIGFGLLAFLGLMIAAFFLGCRFGLAQFAILADNKGPVESLKYSWTITKGHFWELAGVLAISFAISSVVGIVFDIVSSQLSQINTGLSLLVGLVFFGAYMLLALVCSAVLAQRYEQLRSAPAGHKSQVGLNVGAVALAIVVYFVAAFVQAQLSPATMPLTNPYTTTPSYEEYDDTTLPDQTEDQSLEEYYEELRQKYPELYDEYYSDPEVPTTQTQ